MKHRENTVIHILTGKAFSRTNRAHMLAESALMILLQEYALSRDDESTVNLEDIERLYDRVVSKEKNRSSRKQLFCKSLFFGRRRPKRA